MSKREYDANENPYRRGKTKEQIAKEIDEIRKRQFFGVPGY